MQPHFHISPSALQLNLSISVQLFLIVCLSVPVPWNKSVCLTNLYDYTHKKEKQKSDSGVTSSLSLLQVVGNLSWLLVFGGSCPPLVGKSITFLQIIVLYLIEKKTVVSISVSCLLENRCFVAKKCLMIAFHLTVWPYQLLASKQHQSVPCCCPS